MNTKKTGVPESAPVISLESRNKDTKLYQLQQTQLAFFSQPKTMMQVAKQVGVDRANTCRYVATMRKVGAIWLVRKGICPVTRWPGVGFYTTNPILAPKHPVQLQLPFEP
jgi:hypothetical protein